MRISPQQYFGYENNLPIQQPSIQQPPLQSLQLEPTHVLCFVIIAVIAGVALGLAIGSYKK